MKTPYFLLGLITLDLFAAAAAASDGEGHFDVMEDADRIRITGSALEASVRKTSYVTGIEAQSLVDRKTGFRDQGFGLDIVDWIMEPGSDEAYRDKLPGDLPYLFGNSFHGNRPKRSIEGPQICTKAGHLAPTVIRGRDFVAVRQDFTYTLAAPGKKAGSRWEQTIVFPAGKRYFVSSDTVTTLNSSDAMFLRVDMPGHIKHAKADTFSEVYLSYHGKVPASAFLEDFPPDARLLYTREPGKVPRRMIRAYHLRDPKTGMDGPWLAGMTLDAGSVAEAWCHQRGYVCMIEEIGGRAVKPGETFGAAFVVGFFDSIEEMEQVYDLHAGATRIEVDERGWKLTGAPGAAQGAGQGAVVRVGIDDGDIRGADGAAIQAAVDRVAQLGGGTVRIGPGRYVLRDALALRDGVRIAGEPGKTILAACDGAQTPLALDGDCNQREVTLADPSRFRVGDGIVVHDGESRNGFAVTTATLTGRVDERTFTISRPLYLDYMVSNRATASLAFPVVGGWGVRNAAVEGLVIEGNRKAQSSLDGCRGGGIYLFESRGVAIRNCIVRDYNGDGISFQVSEDVLVEDCVAEGNAGLGLHPGSGSKRPIVRGNRSAGNGGDGLFVCWRVQRGRFEGNEILENGKAGISIGHKDTDNLFIANRILRNKETGVYFRNETEPMGAHRNVFERNVILDNGEAAVTLRGEHRDLVFRDNTLGNSKPAEGKAVGFSIGGKAPGLLRERNRIENVSTEE